MIDRRLTHATSVSTVRGVRLSMDHTLEENVSTKKQFRVCAEKDSNSLKSPLTENMLVLFSFTFQEEGLVRSKDLSAVNIDIIPVLSSLAPFLMARIRHNTGTVNCPKIDPTLERDPADTSSSSMHIGLPFLSIQSDEAGGKLIVNCLS